MKHITLILLCCSILFGSANLSLAQPNDGDMPRKRPSGGGPDSARPSGNDSNRNRPSSNDSNRSRPSGNDSDRERPSSGGPDSGSDSDRSRPSGDISDRNRPSDRNFGGSTSGAGAAYFYSSNAFRLRKIYPDGTLLLVSKTKGYDWAIKQYYDVLKKVELIGLRLPNSQDICHQEYFDRLQQLVATELLYVEYDKSVQSSDINVQPVYLWTKGGQLINLQLIQEGYAAVLALDDYKYQPDFLAMQDMAQQQQRGIWSSEEQCVAAPLPAMQSVASPFKTDDKPKCQIKGLISSDGTLKYCLSPGDKNYDVITVRSERGERWFCSKEDARDSGWACY